MKETSLVCFLDDRNVFEQIRGDVMRTCALLCWVPGPSAFCCPLETQAGVS